MWSCIVTNLFLIKPTDPLISQIYFVKKLYMFRAVPLPVIRSFPLYIRHWYMLCRFVDSFQARPGWNCSSFLVVLESCHQNCMTKTSAECTVENSWWWVEELPETCRVSWQNIFGKLVRLLVLLKRNFTVMFTYHYNVAFCCVKCDFVIFVLKSTSELLSQFLRKTGDNIMMLLQTWNRT